VQLSEKAIGEDKLNVLARLADTLLSNTATPGRQVIRRQLVEAQTAWNQLSREIVAQCRRCEECVDTVQTFADSLTRLSASLDEYENRLRVATHGCSAAGTVDETSDQLKTLKVCSADTIAAATF